MAVTWKKLAYETDVITKATLGANEVMIAVTSATPTGVALAASQMIGRKSTGDIVALAKADILTIINVEDGADATDATNVAAAGAVMESDFTAKGALVVGTGTGTAAVLTVGTNGYILTADSAEATGTKWAAAGGTGDFKADGTVPMTGNLDVNEHQVLDMVVQQVANEAAVGAYATPVVGKILFATSELSFHICTVAA
jgi:hypothetical protein